MNSFIKVTNIMCVFLMVGCGGGGSESSQPVATAQPPSAGTGTTTPEPIKTQDLVASQEFDFSTQIELVIDVSLPELTERSFLNVCYSEPTSERIDYSNCVLRVALLEGSLVKTVTLNQVNKTLLADIWTVSASSEPLQYQWQYQGGSEYAKFEIR